MTIIFNEEHAEARQAGKIQPLPVANRTYAGCRRCKNKFCERIKRGKLIKTLVPWLPIKHYMCDKCFRKFYRF